VSTDDYAKLKEALSKLKLSDAALSYEPETSLALSFGFRCGFLGLLHMEIVQERLEREYDLNLIATAPSVIYKIKKTNGEELVIDNPSELPDPTLIDSIFEPYIDAKIIVPADYIGVVMTLCQEKRGIHKNTNFIDTTRPSSVTNCPWPKWSWTFSINSKARQRVTLRSITSDGLSRRTHCEGRHSFKQRTG